MFEINKEFVSDLEAIGIIPSDLVIYVTSKCNLRCKHCYVGNELLNSANEIDIEAIKTILGSFRDLDRITVLGGEPILHPQFPEILQCLASVPAKSKRLDTNLMNIDQLDVSLLLSGIRVCVSLDGHNEATHAVLRGRNTFQKTVDNLRTLLSQGVDVEVTQTIHKKNRLHLKEFFSFCRSLGLEKVNLHKISPRGNATMHDELQIGPDEWIELTETVRDWSKNPEEPGMRIRFETLYVKKEEALLMRQDGRYRDLAGGSFYSPSGRSRLVFYPDGKLYISSEAFGSESFIGTVVDGRFELNRQSSNELLLAKQGVVAITALNPLAETHPDYEILSVSFRESLLV